MQKLNTPATAGGPTVLFELEDKAMSIAAAYGSVSSRNSVTRRKSRRPVTKDVSSPRRGDPLNDNSRSRSRSPTPDPRVQLATFNLPAGSESCSPKDIINILKDKAQQADVELLA